ncbi:MAG: regulatory iron-sulfur-containing complex subunit RicT, partial [Chloroflexota bacterium]
SASAPGALELTLGDRPTGATSRGHDRGGVLIPPEEVPVAELEEPLKKTVRRAEERDFALAKEFKDKEKAAFSECENLIKKLGLPMKLLSAEYSFDGNHLTFFFSAEERVDFRKLVRELVGLFRTRVELRQVGSRDEAKLIGDCGRCGRPLCCVSFLREFSPVSIKMAKEQSLPLNPARISGSCGRLLCCLGYESELYRTQKDKMPRVGQRVSTATGFARVVDTNVLKETALVELETGVQIELPLKEITFEVELKPPQAEKAEKAEKPPVEESPSG